MHRALSLAVAILLPACGAEPLAPDFERNLTRRGGCGDVTFFAADTADRVLLTFRVDGLVAEARSQGEAVTTTFDLSETVATAFVEQGTSVADATCDDVIEGRGPRVERTWTAVAGRATVTLRPDANGSTARADLVLQDVVFRAQDGASIEIARMEWTDTLVGWYAG